MMFPEPDFDRTIIAALTQFNLLHEFTAHVDQGSSGVCRTVPLVSSVAYQALTAPHGRRDAGVTPWGTPRPGAPPSPSRRPQGSVLTVELLETLPLFGTDFDPGLRF